MTTRESHEVIRDETSYWAHNKIGTSGPSPLILGYDKADPFFASLTFVESENQVVWKIGRELLACGLFQKSGEGEVLVAPGEESNNPGYTMIDMHSPQGELTVFIRTSHVADFIAKTITIVTPGSEQAYTDSDFENLLTEK